MHGDYGAGAEKSSKHPLAQHGTFASQLREVAQEPPKWAVEGLLKEHTFALLVGHEDHAQKSWLALDLAVARLVGGEWLGFRVRPAAPDAVVVYAHGEGTPQELTNRLQRLCRGRGVDHSTIDQRVLFTAPVTLIPKAQRDEVRTTCIVRELEVAGHYGDDAKSDKIKATARRLAQAKVDLLGQNIRLLEDVESGRGGKIALVVLDTQIYCLKGVENSTEDARAYTRACTELAIAAGAPVLSVTHTSRENDGKTSRSGRGSTQFEQGARAVLRIKCTGDPDRGTDERTMSYASKLNDVHPKPPGRKYRLVDLPNDDDRIDTVNGGVFFEVEVVQPKKLAKKDTLQISPSVVLEVLRDHPDGASESVIRSDVNRLLGKPGRANDRTVRELLQSLAHDGLAACRQDKWSAIEITSEG